MRWRRDDITIPVGEGVFSAVSDDVVIAVFCGTPVTTADLGCDDFRSGGFSVENGATLWLDLGGFLPQRRRTAAPLEVPSLDTFGALLKASGEGRELSTHTANGPTRGLPPRARRRRAALRHRPTITVP